MQAALKAAGRSKAKVGLHTVGHAIDLVPVDAKGNIDFDSDRGFEAIKVAMQQAAEELNVPIRWGGNFRSIVDKPHFELDRKVYPIPGDRPDPNSLLLAFR
jgi:peptidoglycan L-alanyl-D-glutamate endopeptidase CwlK